MDIQPETWDWWIGIWRNLITCGECYGLMELALPCPTCGNDYSNVKPQKLEIDGRIIKLQPTFAGALNWSDYVMLKLMYEEWGRPLVTPKSFQAMPEENRPSQRIIIVILYWSLFENLINRLFERGMEMLPAAVSEDLLKRYSSVGSRIDRLYKIIFGTTLHKDLEQLGFNQLARHLLEVQKRRNLFIHGEPEAINEG